MVNQINEFSQDRFKSGVLFSSLPYEERKRIIEEIEAKTQKYQDTVLKNQLEKQHENLRNNAT